MVDLYKKDDLDGAVMPKIHRCVQECDMRMKCLRHVNCSRPQLGVCLLVTQNPVTCQAYMPIVKEKPVPSIVQEPLPDRVIGKKEWKMWLETHGKQTIAFAFREHDKVTHSFGCADGKDAAIAGCVSQIERIYARK
jgi:hypothetical protein